ncbi:transketolase family protein [Verrucosispora sp. WMMA2044]|uniref:Transketolase family protein n=1 Tax=Verrucosispora sioxanthis TaxID=2499994 RepID=A0A6M1KR13_9ACTN|nr:MULTISPECIES: transketolase C-terminal domain-containing protein [Micromonospora]MCZ7421097.1 transketolase family protein [Verrucosispora sp. WMMA2121]NEE63308.1 transketolase family protein [Verrucosispora sioxanthis]NGM12418.1 transketolase family protein [Verrucosispora sioxanthis]WBB47798.1 transketolase family protein [Verrucosispora sp. WMMA2044]
MTVVEQVTFDCRQAFADELRLMARADERIVAVCNDSVGSSNLVGFREEFPQRLVNVGIAEQDLVGVAAGLANAGKIPFVCAAAPFLTGRALEQIKADVAYSDVHVVLCGQSPGMAYGELGPTHHSIEDLSWMRAVANLDVIVPADPDQTRAAVRWAAASGRPSYLRIPRFKVPAVTPPDAPFAPGTAVRLIDGDDVTVIAIGSLTSRALDAADRLRAEGIAVRVLNMPFVDPIDVRAVLAAARETRGIVTAEEATTTGGLGAAVAAIAATAHPTPMRILGVPRVFAPTGDTAFLLEHFGLTADGIAAAVRDLLGTSDTGGGHG